jgi:hypothetical protein
MLGRAVRCHRLTEGSCLFGRGSVSLTKGVRFCDSYPTARFALRPALLRGEPPMKNEKNSMVCAAADFQLGRRTLIAFLLFQRFSDALRIATRCVTLLQNNPHVIRERLAKNLFFARSAVTRAPKRARPATMRDENSFSSCFSHVVVAF